MPDRATSQAVEAKVRQWASTLPTEEQDAVSAWLAATAVWDVLRPDHATAERVATPADDAASRGALRIRDVMNTKAARVHLDQPLRVAAEILVLTQASDLMVVDGRDRYVGVLPEGELLHAVMPDFEGLLEAGATLHRACQALLAAGSSYAGQPINRLVIRDSITVAPDDELLPAATVMVTKGIRRLAVVDGERFVGSVSRADVCWGLLVEQPSRELNGAAT